MMAWFWYAILSVIANSAMFICFKELQKSLAIEVYLFYAWIISSIVIGLFYIPTATLRLSVTFTLIIIIAGFCSWVGNYAYNYSMSLQPNIGYVEALSSSRIAITYFVSLALFSSKFEPLRVFPLLGLIIGSYLVPIKADTENKTTDNRWIYWSLIAGISFAALAILAKIALLQDVEAPIFIAFALFVASLFYGFSALEGNILSKYQSLLH